MMPRIEAQETLAAVNVAALGAGAGEPLDRQRIFAELQRKAAGAPPPQPVKAKAADLAAMGMAVQAGGDDLPQIASLEDWLGTASSSAAVGEQERSSGASQEGLNDA